jgi:transcriptional regulator with XRE-family HTH domain
VKTIRDICKEYGYSQTALAKRFGIPLRTVQNWHGGQREPAPYVVPMMDEILSAERIKSPSLQRLQSDLSDCRAEVKAFRAEAKNILDRMTRDTAQGLVRYQRLEHKWTMLNYAQEAITEAIGYIGAADDF